MSLGFAQAGFTIAGANEIDEWACQTFKLNHPEATVIHGDIREFSDEEVLQFIPQKIDILLGGPPCQGFSIANTKKGTPGDPKDPRNSLFMEFLRLGKVFNPQIMLMENVPNIVRAKTKSGEYVVDIIEKEMQKLGYYTYRAILHATDYGVPQIRKRFVIIGSKTALDSAFPEPTHHESANNLLGLPQVPSLWDAISDLPSLQASQSSSEYTGPPRNTYQKQLRGTSNVLHNHTAMRHSDRLVKRFESMAWGQKGDELHEDHLPLKRNGNGEKAANGYSQNNRRMFPDKPCHTIAASFYANFVHPFDHRNFTPREGARVQSFPDDFVFLGKPTTPSHSLLRREGRESDIHLGQYNQIGNAVPPLIAYAIASNLKLQIAPTEPHNVRTRRQPATKRRISVA